MAPVPPHCFRGERGPGLCQEIDRSPWDGTTAVPQAGSVSLPLPPEHGPSVALPTPGGIVGLWDREGSSPRTLRCAVAPDLSPETEVGIVLPLLRVQ